MDQVSVSFPSNLQINSNSSTPIHSFRSHFLSFRSAEQIEVPAVDVGRPTFPSPRRVAFDPVLPCYAADSRRNEFDNAHEAALEGEKPQCINYIYMYSMKKGIR